MKTLKNQSVGFLLVLYMILSSCTNKSDDSVSPEVINGVINQGSWEISYFNDSGKDETYKFNGYTFVFESNGSIKASIGSTIHSGSWSTGNDDSRVKLYITFPNIPPLEELNDDWHVIKQNPSIIELTDVSGGNGGTDYLTFSKIN